VADDNNGRVALLFLVFLPVNSLPFLFPPFHLFYHSLANSDAHAWNEPIFRIENKRKKVVSKEEFFSLLCIFLLACIFNCRLNNKSHKLTEKDKYTLEN